MMRIDLTGQREHEDAMIRIKRAYEPAKRTDGYRVLVDRLWPRGIKKTELPLDDWIKELAPSSELRKEFGHDPGNWNDFTRSYKHELRNAEAKQKLAELAERARKSNVTLIYSARDEDHNNAIVLKKEIERRLKSKK